MVTDSSGGRGIEQMSDTTVGVPTQDISYDRSDNLDRDEHADSAAGSEKSKADADEDNDDDDIEVLEPYEDDADDPNFIEHWAAVQTITTRQVREAVFQIHPLPAIYTASDLKVFWTGKGSYNRLWKIRYPDGSILVLRVPVHGSPGRWTAEDAMALRSTALTMRYLHEFTHIPIPDVYSFDESLDNVLGFPYIAMSHLEGTLACYMWADGSDKVAERRRKNILEGLARCMSQLSFRSFTQGGMLHFDNTNNDTEPTVSDYVKFDEGEPDSEDYYTRHKTSISKSYTSSQAQFGLELLYWKYQELARVETDRAKKMVKGQHTIMRLMQPLLPQPDKGEAEDFVLAMPDFNLQNILVDEDGHVTGLIDWDNTQVVPRFLGWSGVPKFLAADVDATNDWNGDDLREPRNLEYYREMYSRFLKEACARIGTNDRLYTLKSHVYQAVVDCWRRPYDTDEQLRIILNEIYPRYRFDRYFVLLEEEGLPLREQFLLEARLRALLELPKDGNGEYNEDGDEEEEREEVVERAKTSTGDEDIIRSDNANCLAPGGWMESFHVHDALDELYVEALDAICAELTGAVRGTWLAFRHWLGEL